MNNLNLIRQIAWSFHRSTGLDWDELFQEAALAYFTALKNYDPKRGTIGGYMWSVMTSSLKNYLKQHYKHNQNGTICSLEEIDEDLPVESIQLFEKLSKDALEIASTILSTPKRYSALTPQSARRRIVRIMTRNKGWTKRRLRIGLHDLKLALSKN